jgi:hypothetical protein
VEHPAVCEAVIGDQRRIRGDEVEMIGGDRTGDPIVRPVVGTAPRIVLSLEILKQLRRSGARHVYDVGFALRVVATEVARHQPQRKALGGSPGKLASKAELFALVAAGRAGKRVFRGVAVPGPARGDAAAQLAEHRPGQAGAQFQQFRVARRFEDTAAGFRQRFEAVAGLLRVYGQHAGARVLAVKRGLRSAQNLDTLDVEQGGMSEQRARPEGAVDEQADRRLESRDVGDVSDAPDAKRGRGRAHAILVIEHRRLRGEVTDVPDPTGFDVLGGERGHRDGHVL